MNMRLLHQSKTKLARCATEALSARKPAFSMSKPTFFDWRSGGALSAYSAKFATAHVQRDRNVGLQATPIPGLPGHANFEPPARNLCDLGSGEMVQIWSWKAAEGNEEEFDRVVQNITFDFYNMDKGLTDVRVAHPAPGSVSFVITFVSDIDQGKFNRAVVPKLMDALSPLSDGGVPCFAQAGRLMPQAHSLASLLEYLKENVAAKAMEDHDIDDIRQQIARWFPRRSEYGAYVSWDKNDPTKYTRNVVHSSPEMEILLMCWPAGAKSSIHCHDDSSCWVAHVEGELHEVQYGYPAVDRRFRQSEMEDADFAAGRCGRLRVINVARLGGDGGGAGTYASNQIGIHRIENRTDQPAMTLHIYAPRLLKMRIFTDEGEVNSVTVKPVRKMRRLKKPRSQKHGVIDVDSWND